MPTVKLEMHSSIFQRDCTKECNRPSRHNRTQPIPFFHSVTYNWVLIKPIPRTCHAFQAEAKKALKQINLKKSMTQRSQYAVLLTGELGSHGGNPQVVVKSTMVHYCEELMGVVVFAKVQGQVKFESPRTRRVCRLSYFASPRTFVKTTTPITFSQ